MCSSVPAPATTPSILVWRWQKKLSAAEQSGHVPTELVPRCPKCGGPMDIHMGAGQRMIPDTAAQARFQNFLKTYHGKKLVVLELGIGWSNQLIKAPMMRLVAGEPNATYVTINLGEIYIADNIKEKSFGIENHFPDIFTPNEIGTYMSGIYSKWERNTYVNYLSKFELPADKRVKDFSKGMKVKLAFAVALSHKAELLILDEATSGLDPIIRDDILDILIDFVQDENHSVLVSSHIISDLEKVADYITFIHKGKLVFTHSKDELVDNYGVMSCGAMVFDNLDKSEIIAYRKEDYQYKVLVKDRHIAEKKYPKAIVVPAAIEEIMLFYVKGEMK